MHLTDEELMLAYQAGDETAFHLLYQRHSGRVLAYFRSQLRNEERAQDLFQSSLLKLHRSREQYRGDLPFLPWLFTICKSELLDHWKREKRAQEEVGASIPEGVVVTSSALEINGLRGNQRKALELRYEKDFSFEEIAKALETSPSNARQLVSRAVKQLRKLYEQK